MSALDRLIPSPRPLEIDRVDLAAPAVTVWRLVRHSALAKSRVIRALFALRTIASRSTTDDEATPAIRIDDLRSSPERPGFQILVDNPPHEVGVAAIGKVWQLELAPMLAARGRDRRRNNSHRRVSTAEDRRSSTPS